MIFLNTNIKENVTEGVELVSNEKITYNLEEFRFRFKFRFHRLLTIPISEMDFERLAAIYGVNAELIAAETAEIEAHNMAYAKKITEQTELSCFGSVPQTRILFLGDSITADRKSYCEILKKVFAPWPQLQVFDTAVPGYKANDLYSCAYPETYGIHADVAHIMVGTNDFICSRETPFVHRVSVRDYEERLDYVVRHLIEDGTKVILSSVPVFSAQLAEKSLKIYHKQFREEDRLEYNRAVRAVAEKYGAVYNDMDGIYNAFLPEEITREDGYHLNEKGQELMASAVLQHLINLLTTADR